MDYEQENEKQEEKDKPEDNEKQEYNEVIVTKESISIYSAHENVPYIVLFNDQLYNDTTTSKRHSKFNKRFLQLRDVL